MACCRRLMSLWTQIYFFLDFLHPLIIPHPFLSFCFSLSLSPPHPSTPLLPHNFFFCKLLVYDSSFKGRDIKCRVICLPSTDISLFFEMWLYITWSEKERERGERVVRCRRERERERESPKEKSTLFDIFILPRL